MDAQQSQLVARQVERLRRKLPHASEACIRRVCIDLGYPAYDFDVIAEVERRTKTKTVRLWHVSLGNGRITTRLYPKARARKLAARYNRLHGGDRAYVAGPLKVRLPVA